MKPSRIKSILVLYLLSVLGMYFAVFWNVRKLIGAGLPDFAIYYCAGTVVRQGLGHQLYDVNAHFDVQRQFATAVPLFRGPLPWTHPPFEALFFVPFSYLSYLHAYVAWNLFSLALLAASLALLRPMIPELRARASGLWILAAVAFFPVFFNLLEGQDAIILLFLYAAAVACLRNDRDVVAGILLAVGLFKFHLILPFVLLMVFQKRWKLLYGFLPAAALVTLASIPIAGVRSFAAYSDYVFYWEKVLEGKDRVPAGMPSLRGLMYVLLPQGSYVIPLLALLSLVFLFMVVWKCRAAASSSMFPITLSLTLIATVLVSYHVVSYDLCILLIPVLLLTNDWLVNRPRRWSSTMILLGIAALFCSPLELYLSLQSRQFALMGVVLLMMFWGICREISLRPGQ